MHCALHCTLAKDGCQDANGGACPGSGRITNTGALNRVTPIENNKGAGTLLQAPGKVLGELLIVFKPARGPSSGRRSCAAHLLARQDDAD